MESPSRALITFTTPPYSAPPHCCTTTSNPLNSPEFEFWNHTQNNPQPFISPLHSADQLFSHGFLLPLHLPPPPRFEPGPVLHLQSGPSALITSDASSSGNPILSASKRWREIFKRAEKKTDISEETNQAIKKVDRKRLKDRKNIGGPGSAELNINIWPFSRSRSAGNNSSRSNKPVQSNRKVSSAPCSRSNSSGESKLLRRSWPSSPGRAGIHLGRASPVWQAKRAGPTNGVVKGKVLNLNVAGVGTGYQKDLSCRSYESTTGKIGGRNGNLFGFRGLFSKKSNGRTVLTV